MTIAAGTGFSGTVIFSVTGAPPRSSARFSPASVVNSGTSLLTVATPQSVQKRPYTLTITGASDSLVHSTSVTLIIQ